MPEPMTTDEAKTKVCPFRSSYDDIKCVADGCACWGWWDPEDGQTIMQFTEREKPFPTENIRAQGWILDGNYQGKYRYFRPTSDRSDRRGRCEAMSPVIEVST